MQAETDQPAAEIPHAATVTAGAWARFTRAPVILQAYIVFVVLAGVTAFAGMAVRPLNDAITPYVGWTGCTLYLYTLFFAVAAATTLQRRIIYGAVGLLGLFVVFGDIEMVRHLMSYDASIQASGNPYLVVHDLRPVWTIVLPATWILLLLSPGMRRWIKAPPTDGDDKRLQTSTFEMLYLMTIVGAALALSLALHGVMREVRELHAAKQQTLRPTPAVPAPRAPRTRARPVAGIVSETIVSRKA